MTQAEKDQIRNLQIIVMALLLGAGTFLAVAGYLVTSGQMPSQVELGGLFLGIWAALGIGGLLAWSFIRNQQASLAAAAIAEAPDDAGRFKAVQRYATATVIGGALAEGTTLIAGVGALLTGHMGLLALGSLGLVAIVRLFPSHGKFEQFVGRGEKLVTTPR
jgi:hypothetical protein